MTSPTIRRCFAAFAVSVAIGASAQAGNHLWVINELFSDASGDIQFIELNESMGGDGETFMAGMYVLSMATSEQFDFPEDITGPTGNKFLLLGTAGFAALPGAPTPDYIITEQFIETNGDTISYPWHDLTFGPGVMPTNGVDSLQRDLSSATNSPTNYAGQTGSVGMPNVPAASTWGLMAIALLLLISGSILVSHRSTSMPTVSCRTVATD